PDWARLPLVILATLATIIASQAVISGAYSISQQAVQLGYLPRLRILHTSARAAGQIYVPLVIWGLLVLVILLVLGFQSSSNLAAAYGIAVTGTMVITACMLGVLTFKIWRWPPLLAGVVTGGFLIVDGAYFASNVTKIPDGGWFPLLVAGIAFTILTTWASGRALVRRRLHDGAMPVGVFIRSAVNAVVRVSGTAVFLSSSADDIPPALLHNLKHNHVLHDRVVLLTVAIQPVPHIPARDRMALTNLREGFYRIVLSYGFMDEPDLPAELARIAIEPPFMPLDTSYYLSRQTLVPAAHPGMALWREKLFAWMVRNAESAMAFFKLPTNRVVELGSQVEI
ncbi:MAG: KUP/HAK/KT family potassium transporter, partial [Sphingomonas sp.]